MGLCFVCTLAPRCLSFFSSAWRGALRGWGGGSSFALTSYHVHTTPFHARIKKLTPASFAKTPTNPPSAFRYPLKELLQMKKTWKILNYLLLDPIFQKGDFKKKSPDKSSLGLLDKTPSFFPVFFVISRCTSSFRVPLPISLFSPLPFLKKLLPRRVSGQAPLLLCKSF